MLRAALAAAAIVTACAPRAGESVSEAPEPARIEIPAGEYAGAFDATREVLLDCGFSLDQIDARAGLITTRAKPTLGLAAPGDGEQRTLGQEWQDFINDQSRVVRVWFSPAPASPPSGASLLGQAGPNEQGGIADLRNLETPVVARVEVVILRRRTVGRRFETEAAQLSSRYNDRALERRGIPGSYVTPLRADPPLEAHLARLIGERLAESADG